MMYLLDSNVFMQAYRNFYDMAIVPLFWDAFAQYIKKNKLVLVDKVYNEITTLDTGLGKWITSQSNIEKYSTMELPVLKNHSKIMNEIIKSKQYNEAAYKTWDDKKVADPWILAVAMKENATIVTHETMAYGGISQKYKKLKIPDVAKIFNIECINLFKFMKNESIIVK